MRFRGGIGAVIVLAVVWPGSARAAPAPHRLSELSSPTLVGSRMELLADESGQLTLADVQASPAWESSPEVPNFGFTTSTFWFRFSVENDSDRPQSRLLELPYPPLDQIDFYVLRSGQPLEHARTGDVLPFAQRPVSHPHFLFPLDLGAREQIQLYLRVQTEGSAQVPLQLWEYPAFVASDTRRRALSGVFYGVMIALTLYNLFLFFSVRDRTYLHLCMYAMAFVLLQAQLDGVAFAYLWPNWPALNAFAIPTAMGFGLWTAAVYTSSLLALPDKVPRVARVVRIFGLICLALALLTPLLPYAFSIRALSVSSGVTAICLFAVGVWMLRRGVRQARFYVLAWTAFLIGTLLIVLSKAGVLPINVITQYAQQTGATVQLLGMSFALADYINIIKAEREAAQRQALEAQTEAAAELQREVDRQTQELREQADKLVELDAQKTRFFQNVSHELRTPLTLILGPLEQLAGRSGDRNARLALQNARRLMQLVNQLLQFQKLAAGRRQLDPRQIDAGRFSSSCGEFVRAACDERGIDFRVVLEPGDADDDGSVRPMAILADVDAMEKILFNYLSNALKFTPEGGRIELRVAADGDRVRIEVRDTGPGIAEDHQNELFQVFSQVGTQSSLAVEGTGLGLALVKELTEAMGGAVGVDSQEGQGSCFWVELPRAPDDVGDSLALIGEVGSHNTPEFTGFTTEVEPRADSTTGGHGDGPAVLVVDDLADMRAFLKTTLGAAGYRCYTAANGSQALIELGDREIDLIVTDWMMPGMSGPELIRKLKDDDALASIPVVLLTARSDEESRIAGTQTGADAFLGKPFNQVELLSLIDNLLRLKDREREVVKLNRHLSETVLKRYLPPRVVEDILAGKMSIDGPPEKYTATVMFADLVGFTELSQRLRASKIGRLLNDYLSEMSEAVFLHGGTVDKFIGDAVMSVFGAPEALEPRVQVERAIACAETMQQGLASISEAWKREGIGPLHLRIGLHQGPIVMGNFGGERRSDFTAIGPAVNLASRLQTSCGPGEVFVSGEVYDYLPEDAAEPAGEFELRGIGTILVYRLVSTPRATIRDLRAAIERERAKAER